VFMIKLPLTSIFLRYFHFEGYRNVVMRGRGGGGRAEPVCRTSALTVPVLFPKSVKFTAKLRENVSPLHDP